MIVLRTRISPRSARGVARPTPAVAAALVWAARPDDGREHDDRDGGVDAASRAWLGRAIVEMSAAMFVPLALLIGPFWAGAWSGLRAAGVDVCPLWFRPWPSRCSIAGALQLRQSPSIGLWRPSRRGEKGSRRRPWCSSAEPRRPRRQRESRGGAVSPGATINDAIFEVLPNAGHVMSVDEPDLVGPRIVAFLQEAPGGEVPGQRLGTHLLGTTMRFRNFYLMKEAPERVKATAPAHAAYWQQLGLSGYAGGPFVDRSFRAELAVSPLDGSILWVVLDSESARSPGGPVTSCGRCTEPVVRCTRSGCRTGRVASFPSWPGAPARESTGRRSACPRRPASSIPR